MKRPIDQLSLSPLCKPQSSLRTKPHTNKLLEDLEYALTNNTLNDKTLVINDTVKIPVNSSILALRSPYFEKLFFSDMKESKGSEVFLTLEEDANVLKEFLSFLYTAIIDITLENEFQLLSLSKYFLVSSLEGSARATIIENIPLKPYLTWNEAIKLNETAIIEECIKYIKENTYEVLKNSNLKEIDKPTLINLLSMESLDIDEIDLFCYVRDWIQCHDASTGDIGELMGLIRFPMIPNSALLKIVKPTQLVNPLTLLEALEYQSLPQASSTSSPRRKTYNNTEIYYSTIMNGTSCFSKLEIISKKSELVKVWKAAFESILFYHESDIFILTKAKCTYTFDVRLLDVAKSNDFTLMRLCSDGNRCYGLLKEEIGLIEQRSVKSLRPLSERLPKSLQTPVCCVFRYTMFVFSENSVFKVPLGNNYLGITWKPQAIGSVHTFTFNPNCAGAIRISTNEILVFGGNSTCSFVFNSEGDKWRKTKTCLLMVADFKNGTQPVIINNCVFAVDTDGFVHCYDIDKECWTIYYKFYVG